MIGGVGVQERGRGEGERWVEIGEAAILLIVLHCGLGCWLEQRRLCRALACQQGVLL